ncbi:MAG: hypothetical protein ABI602_02825 [Candidatus Saccharibacteria bacterium]
MPNRFLPEFAGAAGNARLVHTAEIPAIVSRLDGGTIAMPLGKFAVLQRAREFAQVIDPIDLTPLAGQPNAPTWDELDRQTYSLYETHFGAAPQVVAEQATRIRYAAKAATGLIMAFLEVIPRVVAADEFSNPNEDIAQLARNSVGLMAGWLQLSNDCDFGLTYALMSPKPRQSGSENFYGMRYHAKWFLRQADEIRLNPAKVSHLRNERNKHPTSQDRPQDVNFGCPAGRHVPKLYQAMTAKAAHDNLFGASYQATRINLGYSSK